MGNEAEVNDKKKILTNKSGLNQSNCREILDSDSEKSSREKLKKGISKHTISLSNEDDYEENEEIENEKSNNKINNNKENNNSNYIDYIFIWKEGGNNVKLVGSFNNWKEQIIMKKDSTDKFFQYKIRLKRDKYEYKFVVDNVWKCSTLQKMKKDPKGNINNYIDLTNYKKKKKKKKDKQYQKEETDSFGLIYPKNEELNTEAQKAQELYLNSFYINEATNQKNIGEKQYYKFNNRESYTEEKSYKNLLYSPHVNLNHTLTLCEQKQILQTGLTYRFRNKDCTMIYYSRL